MKEYPSISKEIRGDIPIFAFDKLDGSNIRAEWSRKQGFYKFGTKTRLLGADDPTLGPAIDLICQSYGDGLGKVFSKERYERAICFYDKRTPMPVMFKIKSREWLDRLKEHCKGDEKLFEQLA